LLSLKKPFDTVEASQLANALTEKWWLHAQFRRKMEELESRVAERTHELQHTNHALETEVVEHCRAEESLRLLGSAVEQSKESIVITDAQLDLPGPKILFVNPAFTKMTGYSAEEAIGNTPRILQGPRTDPTVLSRLRRTLQRGEAFEGEGINYRKGGEEFYLEWQIAPIRGAGGNTTHFVAVQHDITARKRTEEALQERAQLAGLEVDVGTALTRGGTLAEMLRLCSEAIVRHLDTAFARVWTLNEREQMLELQASAGLYTHLNGPHGRVPVGKFKIGLIAQERMPHMTNQVVGDPRVNDQEWAKREGIVAFAGYPLVVDDRLLGVVAMFARHSLTQTALQALASVSRNIAVGIERTGGGAVAVQDRAP
jgi:PAS domain S-box-containing protein